MTMPLPTLEPSALPARRALATRNAGWAKALARRLARASIRPNAVSVASVVFAVCAGCAYCLAADVDDRARMMLLLLAAASIQLRLLCNLLDGMLAVEEGLKSKTGDIYNDLPDRIADIVILVGAGCSVRNLPLGMLLGWAAAVMAIFTAYVRLLGGSLGATQPFIGPMAKQHRMFALTIATLLSAVEAVLGLPLRAMRIGLAIIAAGSFVTAWRRTRRIVSEVNAQ